MKNYKLIIEFAQVGDTPPETIIETNFKAPSLEEAQRFGEYIFDQTSKFQVVPLKENDRNIYYHRVFEVN